MEAKKKIITLGESLELEAELAGYHDKFGVRMRGLLTHRLPLSTKYHLSNIHTQVKKDREFFNQSLLELRAELGTEEEILKITSNPKDERNKEFEKKIQDFLQNTQREIEYSNLSMTDLEFVETEDYYPVLFKILS
jgi:hypothetical protein